MSPEKQLEQDITIILLQKAGRLPMNIYEEEYFDESNSLGFFKKLKKKFKKRIKYRFKSAIRMIKNPGKEIKREVKRISKSVKEVAPYVVAGVATYYGGPIGATLGKKIVTRQLQMKAKAEYKKQLRKNMMVDMPEAPDMLRNNTDASTFSENWTNRSLVRKGIKVRSPEANRAIQDYIAEVGIKAEKESAFDIKKLLIPAAVGVGVFMMVKA